MAFRDATSAVIRASGDLRALEYVDCSHPRNADLPSWAIDFDDDLLQPHRMLNQMDSLNRWSFCEGWTAASAKSDRKITVSDGSLVVRGLSFDRVRACAPLIVRNRNTSHGADMDGQIRSLSELEKLSDGLALKDVVAQIPCYDPYCNLKHSTTTDPPQQGCIATCRGDYDPSSIFTRGEGIRRGWFRNDMYDRLLIWYRTLSLPKPFLDANMGHHSPETLSFFVTDAGFIGLGSRAMREGDEIALLYSARYPAVLWQEAGNAYHAFCGLASVCGIFKQELVERIPELELPEGEFVLR